VNRERLNQLKPLIGLLIFSAIISIINPRFLSIFNILNVLRQTSINSIIAAGMTFVILTGGIDLSVGSILAFCGAVSAALIASGQPIVVVLFVALLTGTIMGLLTGVIISRGKVQAFIATLVTMTIVRGATLVFTQGKPINAGIGKASEAFAWLGGGYIMGIPVPVYLMILVYGVAWYTLHQTRFGRYTYALGGNEEAARLSGLATKKLKTIVYGISGFLAALAGIIMTARLSSAQPTAGTGYELDAIAAVVLGGTSLAGGSGRILGTIVGALIIGILNNALNLMNVSSYYQMMAKGAVILIAVLLDRKNQ
jgi:ribose transport system permease protein